MLTRLTSFFLAVCLSVGIVNAEETTPTVKPLLTVVWCDDTEKMIAMVENKYNEKPMMMGKISVQEGTSQQFVNFDMTFYYNKETNSFTIIGLAPDKKTSCMIASGTKLIPYVTSL